MSSVQTRLSRWSASKLTASQDILIDERIRSVAKAHLGLGVPNPENRREMMLDSAVMALYGGPMTAVLAVDVMLANERAQVRGAALREPIESSLVHVRSIAAEMPAIPEPTAEQSLLEGLVIGNLGYLYDPGRSDRNRENFVPLAISTGTDHYTLTARGDHLADALHRLTPCWEVGSEVVEIGVPGLRWFASEWGAGITFHILGLQARFTVEGISVSEFDRLRRAAGVDSVVGDDALTPQEVKAGIGFPDSWRIASIIGRRLGLLLHEGVTAITSWWNPGGMFSVELSVREDAPDPMPEILSQLLSPHLAPPLRLEQWPGHYYFLSVEGSEAEIDLRVRRVVTS